jgi:hypothetical protein
MVLRQYSGNSHGATKYIGIIHCLYDPDGDGKSNRLADNSGGEIKYQHIKSLAWTQAKLAHGQVIKIRISQRAQSQIIPGRGFQKPHGLDRDKRSGSKFIEYNTRCVWYFLED